MQHIRIIMIEGDEEWVKRTLKNSFPEGKTEGIFGKNKNAGYFDERSITITTVHGEVLMHKIPENKPEKRYED